MQIPSETPISEPSVHEHGKWTISEWVEASSTNDLARHLAPWSIARCDFQSSGRGRFNRTWFGEKGGLWTSFTLPLDADAPSAVNWGHLPLLTGLAVLDMLDTLGISSARLRWPNDILVGKSKLAGILVERPSAQMAVIGIGINVFNDIERLAGLVKDTPVRIADLMDSPPSLDQLACLLADCIDARFTGFRTQGLSSIATALLQAWKKFLPVTVATDEENISGTFMGIAEDGSPILSLPDGARRTIPAHTVNQLTEN